MSTDKVNLLLLVEGCRKQNRLSQRKIYEHFYSYGMNIALRFGKNLEEAQEVYNDSFLKVFNRIDQYDPAYPFKAWLRKVIIHSAIDYYRKFHKQPEHLDLDLVVNLMDGADSVPSFSTCEDMLPVVQKLPPAYRMVFNLFVMEGYKHHEIAAMLDISVGTSKSNLARAKIKLREFMLKKSTKSIKTK